MAVEVLFLSVVLRKAALAGLEPGRRALAAGLFRWQPAWFREDPDLMATTFMCPRDTRNFGSALEARTGLARGRDWAVVDQLLGPVEPVDWLEWRGGPGQACGVWLAPGHPGPLAKPKCRVPGIPDVPNGRLEVCNVFGKDHDGDPGSHRQGAGGELPVWGGRDLWVVGDPSQGGHPLGEIQWLIFEVRGTDFMDWQGEG